MAVPVTADRDHAAILTIGGLRAAPVTRPPQCLSQFALDHGMNEAAHALAHLRFNRIKPVVERYTAVSPAGCENSGFVIVLFMAWSPARRSNVG
jgi:hypothetical protein